MGFLKVMLLGLSDTFMANVNTDTLSADEMRPFRIITVVDLVKNASFRVSLAECSGHYCRLGITLQPFPAPFVTLYITAHKAHQDKIFIL